MSDFKAIFELWLVGMLARLEWIQNSEITKQQKQNNKNITAKIKIAPTTKQRKLQNSELFFLTAQARLGYSQRPRNMYRAFVPFAVLYFRCFIVGAVL